jgi:hypothetical protein
MEVVPYQFAEQDNIMKETILSAIGQCLCWLTDKSRIFHPIAAIYICTLYICGYDKSENIT